MPASPRRLLLLFGDQLFANREVRRAKPDGVFMAESERMCRRYRAHRHKLVLILSGMRSKADALRKAGYEVHYYDLAQTGDRGVLETLRGLVDTTDYDELAFFDTESAAMNLALGSLCDASGLRSVVLQSPKFITSHADFGEYRSRHKRLFMADFYRWQRRRLGVLVDAEGKPEGGRWSFDDENRKKLPKDLVPPALPDFQWTQHTREVVALVDDRFADHPGRASSFWLPTTQAQAKRALDRFLSERFHDFGDYEDALSSRHGTVYHSVLSPLLNVGLLTPAEVVDRALASAEEHGVPLNSLEGFVRQMIGWREFIRGVWHALPASHWAQNHWGHDRRLTEHWYEGTTGIPPLDDAIRRARATGYNHHIERLMVIGNSMLLCRVEPRQAYRWFMEMYADSADWVMAPNVYGMALFSEGGAFTTKPYICGSNYLRKMSDYGKGPWCDVMDGLYWSFVARHRDFFSANPRSSMMVRSLDRMDAARRDRIFGLAEAHVDRVTVAG